MATATGAVAGLAGAAGVVAYTSGAPGAEREDCPGKIVCPLTGELACRDQCPVTEGEAQAAAPVESQACCCESGCTK